MRQWLKGLFSGGPTAEHLALISQDQRTDTVALEGADPFEVVRHFYDHEGLPIPDWQAIENWTATLPVSIQSRAWGECVRTWLLHMRDALGDQYELMQSTRAQLIAPVDARRGAVALRYMESTLDKVLEVLPGVADAKPEWKPILMVFEDAPRYYDYISHVYAEGGEYGFSGGMFLGLGPGHFVTTLEEFEKMEPIIAHEMTHACLRHLEIPLWLNEGLAVNTERRLVGHMPSLYGPHEMHAKHLEFWNADTVQEFWSGEAFRRSDDGMMLAYDLAAILVASMSREWQSFRAFANAASYRDGGEWAARTHLHVDLGQCVASLFGANATGWAPSVQEANVVDTPI